MKALNIHRRLFRLMFVTTILFLFVNFSFAQVTVTLTATQSLNFGVICLTGSAGTVTVASDGSRTSTGDLILLSITPVAQPAILEIEYCPGGSVSLTFDATTILTNSKGGELTLDLGPTEKGISGTIFTTVSDCNIITPVNMGGTLHIPATAPTGTYIGSFAVTINLQ